MTSRVHIKPRSDIQRPNRGIKLLLVGQGLNIRLVIWQYDPNHRTGQKNKYTRNKYRKPKFCKTNHVVHLSCGMCVVPVYHKPAFTGATRKNPLHERVLGGLEGVGINQR